MRRLIIALGAILITAVGAITYMRQAAPRSTLGDAVGVRRDRPFDGYCGWFVRNAGVVTYPTGEAVCAWYRPDTPGRRAEVDQLKFHAVTRRVHRSERSWEPLSEQAWRRDVDSIRAGLHEQGGVLACALRTPSEVREYWRFPGFDISLFTGVVATASSGDLTVPPRWFLFLRGAPDQLRACHGVQAPPV